MNSPLKQVSQATWNFVRNIELSTWLSLAVLVLMVGSLIDHSWAVVDPFSNLRTMVTNTKSFTTTTVTALIAICIMVAGGLSAMGKIHWMWFVSSLFGAAVLALVDTIMDWAAGR